MAIADKYPLGRIMLLVEQSFGSLPNGSTLAGILSNVTALNLPITMRHFIAGREEKRDAGVLYDTLG